MKIRMILVHDNENEPSTIATPSAISAGVISNKTRTASLTRVTFAMSLFSSYALSKKFYHSFSHVQYLTS